MSDKAKAKLNDVTSQAPQPNSSRSNKRKRNQNKKQNPSKRVKLNGQPKRQVQSSNTDSAQILKLNLHCFNEVFAFLSIRELNVLSQTCKQMQSIVGYFVREYLPAFRLTVGSDNNLYSPQHGSKYRFHFEHGIQSLKTDWCKFESRCSCERKFIYLGANCNKNVKKLHFNGVHFTDNGIRSIKDILENVETVSIYDCEMKILDNLLSMCQNVKHLYVNIRDQNILKGVEIEWFHRKLPKLESFGWKQDENGCKIAEISRFFELNPNVRHFSTDINWLYATQDLLIDSNVKFDELSIGLGFFNRQNGKTGERISPSDFLNELHDRGVYRRLHIKESCNFQTQDIIDMASIKGLESISSGESEGNTFLSLSKKLKILEVKFITYDPYLDEISRKNVNLESLSIYVGITEDILPFVLHSPKLKTVKLYIKTKDACPEASISNWEKVNEERKKLPGAEKVVIYLHEDAYLANKWNCKSINFDLVEIRRIEQFVDYQNPFLTLRYWDPYNS